MTAREAINLINANYDAVKAAIREADKAAYMYSGCEYRVYIYEDGTVDYEEYAMGDPGHSVSSIDRELVTIRANKDYYDVLHDWYYYDTNGEAPEGADEEADLEQAVEEFLDTCTEPYEYDDDINDRIHELEVRARWEEEEEKEG